MRRWSMYVVCVYSHRRAPIVMLISIMNVSSPRVYLNSKQRDLNELVQK